MGCFTALKRCWRSSPGNADSAASSLAGSPQDRRRASLDTPCPRSSSGSQGTPELPTQPSTLALGAYSPESQEREAEPPQPPPREAREEAAAEVPEGMWACPQCTYLNSDERSSCEMCRGSRPETAARPPLPILETAQEAEISQREARPPTSGRQKRSPPSQQKREVKRETKEPAVLAQEVELDRSLDAAKHQGIRLSILADDLEVDHDDLLFQLQQARERLATLEQEDAKEEEDEERLADVAE